MWFEFAFLISLSEWNQLQFRFLMIVIKLAKSLHRTTVLFRHSYARLLRDATHPGHEPRNLGIYATSQLTELLKTHTTRPRWDHFLKVSSKSVQFFCYTALDTQTHTHTDTPGIFPWNDHNTFSQWMTKCKNLQRTLKITLATSLNTIEPSKKSFYSDVKRCVGQYLPLTWRG